MARWLEATFEECVYNHRDPKHALLPGLDTLVTVFRKYWNSDLKNRFELKEAEKLTQTCALWFGLQSSFLLLGSAADVLAQ